MIATQSDKIVAVGHRGTKKFAPENTLPAHEKAYTLGARAIEFDIRCTSDGHFVLMHNPWVNTTTNGSGFVHKMSLSQIEKLDAGAHKGPKFKGTKVPTLREALRNVKGRFAVDLDFKGGPKNSADILDKLLDEEGPFEHLITIFVRIHHFDMLKSLSYKYKLRPHFLTRKRTEKWAQTYPLKVMGLRRSAYSVENAKAITDNGLLLFSNVMGKKDNLVGYQDAINVGSRFIQTDHLDVLVPYLQKNGLYQPAVLDHDFNPIV